MADLAKIRGEIFSNIRAIQDRMAKRQALQDADAEAVSDLKAILADMSKRPPHPQPEEQP